jgi:hypothetical protein
VSGPTGNRAKEALRKRFEAEEEQAIDALAQWIGHLAVQDLIEQHRGDAERVGLRSGGCWPTRSR